MLVNRLRLRNFRTYERLDLHLSAGVSLLHGPNAAGKTNLLEAIYVLATTKSFRTRTDRELIAWHIEHDEGQRYTRLEADAESAGGPTRVEMVLVEQPVRGAPDVSVRKQFRLNGAPKRAGDIVGSIKAVFFSPDDVTLVTGSPSGRRRYMDLMLCQIDHRYLQLLQEYGRVVVQRNSLLQRLRGRPDPATLLEFWNDRLVDAGTQIMITRRSMLRVLSSFAGEAYADISGEAEDLGILYRPSLEGAAETPDSDLATIFRERLHASQTKEIFQGVTLTGPHRDDLEFRIDGVDAQLFGSRGQQRSVALALRFAELRYMTNRTGEQPVLLLDEAMAELDTDRRRLLLATMESYPQILATTSNIDAFPLAFREQSTLLYVSPGDVHVTLPARARAG